MFFTEFGLAPQPLGQVLCGGEDQVSRGAAALHGPEGPQTDAAQTGHLHLGQTPAAAQAEQVRRKVGSMPWIVHVSAPPFTIDNEMVALCVWKVKG